MITYCGLRHFYIRNFTPSQADSFYILTYNKNVWDFSPGLERYSAGGQKNPAAVYHYEKPVLTVPITLADFQPFSRGWHDFCLRYTNDLEPEYPHSWYLRFSKRGILEQFASDFEKKLQAKEWEGIWGAGPSKIVAKLAAHNRAAGGNFITQEQAQDFLNRIPLHRLPLPEAAELQNLGIKTVGELNRLPLPELISHFGARAEALARLGRGEDLTPFQTQPILDFKWELDCTVLEGFFRPLTTQELKPYIERGAQRLADSLKEHNRAANLLELKAVLPSQTALHSRRKFKKATNEPQVLKRAAEDIIPKEPLARLSLVVSELETSLPEQLNMFVAADIPRLPPAGLPAQRGVEVTRRERFLLLWKEYFHYE